MSNNVLTWVINNLFKSQCPLKYAGFVSFTLLKESAY